MLFYMLDNYMLFLSSFNYFYPVLSCSIQLYKFQMKRLKTKVDHTHGISQSKLARIFNVSQSYICKKLMNKTIIRYRKNLKVPKRTDQQKNVLRMKCRKLSKIFRDKEAINDDK